MPSESDHDYSGFGYVKGLGFTGSELLFTVHSKSEGSVNVTLRCRCLDTRDKEECHVLLNGEKYIVSIPEAGVWQEVPLVLTLREGDNLIRASCNISITHDFHVDYLEME